MVIAVLTTLTMLIDDREREQDAVTPGWALLSPLAAFVIYGGVSVLHRSVQSPQPPQLLQPHSPMMAPAVTFEHDGVLYEVQDYRYDGVHERRIQLNSRHADARRFIPRDRSKPTRVYFFRNVNDGTSDPDTLAQQFKFSYPTTSAR